MAIDVNFFENLSDDLKRTVSDASKAIMDVYERNTFDTEIKSDGSPVTEADENANKIIIQSLSLISPDISIVSEETSDNKSIKNLKDFWLIDPIDGTYDYINNLEEFTINAGLIINNNPVIGLINAPSKKRMFYSYGNNLAFVTYGKKSMQFGECGYECAKLVSFALLKLNFPLHFVVALC